MRARHWNHPNDLTVLENAGRSSCLARRVARIELGRFIAWGMGDVPMVALGKRLRCPECGARGPAEIGTGWLGRDAERDAKVPGLKFVQPESAKVNPGGCENNGRKSEQEIQPDPLADPFDAVFGAGPVRGRHTTAE